MIKLPLISDKDVSGKNVLVRGDLDVPIASVSRGAKLDLSDGGGVVVEDASRLEALVPTLNFLRRGNAGRITIAGHVGRPRPQAPNSKYQVPNNDQIQNLKIDSSLDARAFSSGQAMPAGRQARMTMEAKIDNELSTRPIEEWFRRMGYIREEDVVLENLRFNSGEEKNDLEFAKELSVGQDLYINDAFATCHREAASTCAITKLLPHFAGMRLLEEVETLSKVVEKPKRPLVIVLGGAKLETKMPLVSKMYEMADYVLVGGLLSAETRTLMALQNSKLDFQKAVLLVAELTVDTKDITEESAENFRQVILEAGTVVWNGPMGLFEKNYDRGTEVIAEAVSLCKGFRVVGGGDTLSAIQKYRLGSNYDFVSMGGGAMLSFLAGEEVPGIEALLR